MTSKAQLFISEPGLSKDHEQTARIHTLAVGEPQEWQQQGHPLPTSGLAFVALHEVTQATLDDLQPSVVFSPLLAKNFDCIDLAVLLNGLGYSGEYRAVAVGIPKPDLIEREVRQLCPQLKFSIVETL
ncbi:MAG: hypothetical protein ACU0GG_02865 [Paracoccaceae bacterium]